MKRSEAGRPIGNTGRPRRSSPGLPVPPHRGGSCAALPAEVPGGRDRRDGFPGGPGGRRPSPRAGAAFPVAGFPDRICAPGAVPPGGFFGSARQAERPSGMRGPGAAPFTCVQWEF